MRDRNEILKDIIELNGKIEALEESISEKKRELSDLKVGHKKLVVATVGHDRQPASLKVQREKILELETILEIESETIQELKARSPILKAEDKECERQDLLNSYLPKVDEFFSKVNAVREKLISMFNQVGELEVIVQDLINTENPVNWLNNVVFSGLTFEEYQGLEMNVNFDELNRIYNQTTVDWRNQGQRFNMLIQKAIGCLGGLRMTKPRIPDPPKIDRGVEYEPNPTSRLENPDGPQGIFKNPQNYSIHDQRKHGLIKPSPGTQQPTRAAVGQ
jgi:hypothetical protein